MTHFCSECVTNWWPYQTTEGSCPKCGSATKRSHDPASDGIDERFRVVLAERIKRERRERFEVYYTERELQRIAA